MAGKLQKWFCINLLDNNCQIAAGGLLIQESANTPFVFAVPYHDELLSRFAMSQYSYGDGSLKNEAKSFHMLEYSINR